MTALAGIWYFDGTPKADESCARMLAAQQVYGVHDVAQWSDRSIALGRRLMRLLPEDEFDSQPLVGGGGRYVLVADIRLDNRDEVARRTEIPQSRARTMSDAAILLAAIELWGEACVEYIVGDYAFACWDTAHQRLTLARDPLGQRPLHFHRSACVLAFASMPKGLHALTEVPYLVDETKIAETLALLPETGSRSFFAGVERVEPGHIVTVTAAGFKKRKHWQPRITPLQLRNADEYCDALREQLVQAVACRLRGNGDVGVYLSGGLDSGAVAATAARLLANSSRRLIAFTGVPRTGYSGASPPKRIIDEGYLASQTAALYPNIVHVIVPNSGHSPLSDLDRWAYLNDRPVGAVSSAGWAHSLDVARRSRNVSLMLGGALGNMGLSYDGMELLPELLSRGRWWHLSREVRALVRSRRMSWRGAMVHTVAPWIPPAIWVWLHKVANRDVPELRKYSAINPARLAELDAAKVRGHDFSFRPWRDGRERRLWILSRTDPGNSQKGAITSNEDYRDPTADVRLLEFCLSVPTDQFLRNGVPRALALRALADRLPKSVLDETRRGLQVADWHEDIGAARLELTAELDRLESCEPAARAIDLPRLRSLVENWPTGGWDRDEVVLNYRYALQRAVAVGHFVRRATRSNR